MTAVAAAVALAACAPSGVTAPPTIRPASATGAVVGITDGDTIDVGTEDGELTVRLAGINAPERDECYYQPALDHLTETLRGVDVTIEQWGTDQFGRALAHVFAQDRHVNDEMVSNGLAIADPDPDDPYASSLIDAELAAFESGSGLWGMGACGGIGPRPMVDIDPAGSETDPPGPDHETLSSETVAVVNRSDDVIDVGGWSLRDASSRHRYTFDDQVSLGPGDSIVVTSGDAGWSPGGEAVWSNDGDVALLQDPAGNVVSRWRY